MAGLFGSVTRTKANLLLTVTKPIKTAKLVKGNKSTLRIEYQDGTSAIRYHDTDVVTFGPNGNITLNSDGHRTMTTKGRINEHTKVKVWADRGHWYCYTEVEQRVFFYDGIVFNAAGKLISKRRELNSKKIDAFKKKVAKFIKRIDTMEEIPFPNMGDCWYCSMKEVNSGLPLGDCSKNFDHLADHIKDGYLHGSLIFNALAEKGYQNPAVIIHMAQQKGRGCRDSIKRALRVYLMKRLCPDVATR